MNDMLMSFFVEEGAVYFAEGNLDDQQWNKIGKKPFLFSNGGSLIIRDPFIGQDIDGIYHIIYTESWWGNQLGHASSTDLFHWGNQWVSPIMNQIPNASAVWAPEFYTDERSKDHMVYWTGFIKDHPSIWYSHTKNFKEYTKPQILFDPGYPVIDATIVRGLNRFIMAFKDEREEHKAIRFAFSDHLIGPYKHITPCVTPYGTEGPILKKHKEQWLLYFDKYTKNDWGLMKSPDIYQWSTADIKVPSGARHGSIIPITLNQLKKLIAGTQAKLG